MTAILSPDVKNSAQVLTKSHSSILENPCYQTLETTPNFRHSLGITEFLQPRSAQTTANTTRLPEPNRVLATLPLVKEATKTLPRISQPAWFRHRALKRGYPHFPHYGRLTTKGERARIQKKRATLHHRPPKSGHILLIFSAIFPPTFKSLPLARPVAVSEHGPSVSGARARLRDHDQARQRLVGGQHRPGMCEYPVSAPF